MTLPKYNGPLPQFMPLRAWMTFSGMSRSGTYKRLATGELRGRKLGNRLLIEVEHGLRWLNTLPAAEVRLPNTVLPEPIPEQPPESTRRKPGRPRKHARLEAPTL
jgi:hypothetical protein